MTTAAAILVLAALARVARLTAPLECVNFVLNDPNGPQLAKLSTRLARSDWHEEPTVSFPCEGNAYDVSEPDRSLAARALEKGLPEHVLCEMLRTTGHTAQRKPPPPVSSARLTRSVSQSEPKCAILTSPRGDLTVAASRNLAVPLDQMPVLAGLMDPRSFTDLLSMLRESGVPVAQRDGYTNVLLGDDISEPEVGMRMVLVDGKLVRMDVNVAGKTFSLPQEREDFNKILHHQPDLAYPMMKLFAKHGIPAIFDCQQRTLSVPSSKAAPSHAPPPTGWMRPDTPLRSRRRQPAYQPTEAPPSPLGPLAGLLPPIPALPPMPGGSPKLWFSFGNEPRAARPSSQRHGEPNGPERVRQEIFAELMEMRDQLLPVMRGEEDCVFHVAGQPFSMSNDSRALAAALQRSGVPRQLVMDSLVRVGLAPTASCRNGKIRVALPSGRTCYLNGLANHRMLEHTTMVRSGSANDSDSGAVTVKVGNNEYTLPQDAPKLETAMHSGKVLPLELADALNENEIPTDIDVPSKNIKIKLPGKSLSMPLPQLGKGGNLKLHALEGPLGTTYMIEYDGGRLHLPSEVDKLNALIAGGVLNSHDVLFLLLQNTFVPYKFDKDKKVHVIEVAGQRLEITPSPMS